ncbi:MAG TPA: dihydroorotase [Actinomycetota bacterium]|jgi:dihydroorotase
MPEQRFLLSNARVVDPAGGRDEVLDVLIEGTTIAEVGTGLVAGGAETLDCDGLVLAPGLVDLHTHLREPGREDKETVESGSRAAAAGGFTAVSPMANTDPVADNAAVIHEVRALAAAAGLCDVFPVGAITRGLAGEEMAEIGEMVEAGVRVFSDDGRCVPSARVLRNALYYARAFPEVIIAEHCEDPSLAEGGQMHEGFHSYSLGLAGQPREAEEVIVARDLALARLTGGRLHLCHLSSAGSVDMVRRAKAEGLRVSAEVTPHHLVFADEDLVTYDTNRKVHPPLRSVEDRDALWEGLADGTIDAVATDHAPHAVEEKEAEFDQSPPGTIGLETALAAVLTHGVATGRITLARAVEALSGAPAAILGAGDHGGPIEAGATANLVAFDPDAEWVVEAPFVSKSRNSAFLGRTLSGRVVHTLYRGEPVVANGKAQR